MSLNYKIAIAREDKLWKLQKKICKILIEDGMDPLEAEEHAEQEAASCLMEENSDY